ncbi:MAG TPA: tripartite tricarboxylate transporter substrate binding protein, partial [Casimicrobiaceae bacterium]|nr:tripartite tricarboxylate transporter substrate binding protein [Casimicrobiaceae bacterium]
CAGASAQTWPTRPIKIIVSQSPGGVTDVVTRAVTDPLTEELGVPIIVENKPGASGILGTDLAAKAAPDGYTLLMFLDINTILPSLHKDLQHDAEKSFAPITLIARGSHVLVANPALPVNSLSELIAYAKANPGKLSYASPGTGSPQHLAAETLKLRAGIDMTHVPYKGGGQAVADVLGGQVQLGMLGVAPVLSHIKAGKLKAIAVTGRSRVKVLPDVPTMAETVLPGFETIQWQGLVAPAGTPPAVIARLHAAMTKVMRNPAVIERLSTIGMEAVTSPTPDDFRQMIAEELKRWPAVVQAAGVSPE